MSTIKNFFNLLIDTPKKIKNFVHYVRNHTHIDQKIDRVGLALTSGAGHVGLLYTKGGNLRLLHVTGDMRLKDQDPPHDYHYFSIPISDINILDNISALCRRILRNNPNGFPYGWGEPRNAFDHHGSPSQEVKQKGLTCAAFVCAIFDIEYKPILHYDSWESRPSDTNKQQEAAIIFINLASEARRAGDFASVRQYTAAHQRIMNNIGAFRYAPSEVVTGAINSPPPLKCRVAERLGCHIVKLIN